MARKKSAQLSYVSLQGEPTKIFVVSCVLGIQVSHFLVVL